MIPFCWIVFCDERAYPRGRALPVDRHDGVRALFRRPAFEPFETVGSQEKELGELTEQIKSPPFTFMGRYTLHERRDRVRRSTPKYAEPNLPTLDALNAQACPARWARRPQTTQCDFTFDYAMFHPDVGHGDPDRTFEERRVDVHTG